MRGVIKPEWIEKYTNIYKEDGFKGIMKLGGKKLIILFILFYLVRDSILYILPFYLGYSGVKSFF